MANIVTATYPVHGFPDALTGKFFKTSTSLSIAFNNLSSGSDADIAIQ